MKNILRKSTALLVTGALILCQLSVTGVVNVFDDFNAKATVEYSDDYDEFLDDLGEAESGNNYSLSGRGYYGRWMIGSLGLQEAGLMTAGGAWTNLAASFGVYNATGFCNSVECQDYAILVLHKKNWSYLQSNGAASHIGETYDGVKVTMAGLIAAAHLVGAWGVSSMFNGGYAVDGNGVSALSYMRRFGSYDIEDTITGKNTTVNKNKAASATTTDTTTTSTTDVTSTTTSTSAVTGTSTTADVKGLKSAGTVATSTETTVSTTTTSTSTSVTTTTTSATTEETPVLLAATPESSDDAIRMYGDVNGDSSVTSVDAANILTFYANKLLDDSLKFTQYLKDNGINKNLADVSANGEKEGNIGVSADSTGSEPTYSIGDVNGDGKVDSADATVILVFYADELISGGDASAITVTTAASDTETTTTTSTTVATENVSYEETDSETETNSETETETDTEDESETEVTETSETETDSTTEEVTE